MAGKSDYDVILDCYSDEPSGYGVPPFLGVHQRYISGALNYLNRRHYYVTIDDLRYALGQQGSSSHESTDISTRNLTLNRDIALSLLNGATRLLIVMGCFVDYDYVSAYPPTATELHSLVSSFTGYKILVYVLGSDRQLPLAFRRSALFCAADEVVTGLVYNYLLNGHTNSFDHNYELLAHITREAAPIVEQIGSPRIMEIETMMGCNWGRCSFCIERVRGVPITFRQPDDIIAEVESLYTCGMRCFRLGRNPNFYSYMDQNVSMVEALLYGIRTKCPQVRTLHIDNVNPESVVTPAGRQITQLIVRYCTSGNVAPLGIESFDPVVRHRNSLNATVNQIMEAIAVLNEYGQEKGKDGVPRFLPGINLIHGLPGEGPETLSHNLEYLTKIMDSGCQTRRLFYRRLSSPLGVSMGRYRHLAQADDYESQRDRIYEEFAVPMLSKVFPVSSIVKDARVEVWQRGNSLLRQLKTCPTRIIVASELLPLDVEFDVVIKGVLGHRTLRGEVLREASASDTIHSLP